MPVEGLGTADTRQHIKMIERLVEEEQYYRDQLSPVFQGMVKNWKLYLGDRDDPRLAHEKDWRANVHVPWPYSSVETQVATVSDIIFSNDMPISPDPVGLEDEEISTKMSRLLDYSMRRMRFRSKFDVSARESCIQSTSVRKALWIDKRVPFHHFPTEEEKDNFDKAVLEAAQRGAGEPPGDVDQLLIWVDLVNEAGTFGQIPEPPMPGPKEFIQQRGPGWEETPLYDLRFDPSIQDWQDFPLIIQRMVKPAQWVERRTGDAADFPFDPVNVAAGLDMDQGEDERFSKWEMEIAGMLGIHRGATTEPRFRKLVELWECWRPGEKYPYMMVLNRKVVINKFPNEMPYWHQQHPYHPLRNVLLPGKALGLAEMTQMRPLFIEMDTMRNLRIDSITMAILPILLRLKDLGLPEQLRRLIPGMIIDVSRIDGVKSLSDNIRIPSEAFREEDIQKRDVDETQGTQDIVRGSSAPFSRTTATEITNRLDRALGRQKQRVMRIEDELSPVIPQWLMLMNQFAPLDWKVRTGGRDPSKNPFQRYSRTDFWEGLQQDFRFRGATRALNKDIQGQQLQELFARALASPQPVLSPTEARSLLKRVFQTFDQRGISQIFTEQGEQFVSAQSQLMMQAMIAQMGGGEGEGDQPA